MRAFVLLVIAGGVMSCGGGHSTDHFGGNPTAPTPTPSSTPTVSNVVVTGPNPLNYSSVPPYPYMVGTTEQMSVVVTLSNNTQQSDPSGTWGTDAPTVATVSQTGLVTTVGVGDASVFFDMGDGKRGSAPITVIADVKGTWKGTFQVTECSETGSFATDRFCRDHRVGSSVKYSVALGQTGWTVIGHWNLGNFDCTSLLATCDFRDGDSNEVGTIVLTAERTVGALSTSATWRLTQPGLDQLAGTIETSSTRAGSEGQGVVKGTIQSASRSK